jgi:hypothetical protein
MMQPSQYTRAAEIYRRLAKAVILQSCRDMASTRASVTEGARAFMFSEERAQKAARTHWLSHAELPHNLFAELQNTTPEQMREVLKHRGRVGSLAKAA